MVRKTLFKRDFYNGVLWWGREIRLNSGYKDKRGVMAKEQGEVQWMENY